MMNRIYFNKCISYYSFFLSLCQFGIEHFEPGRRETGEGGVIEDRCSFCAQTMAPDRRIVAAEIGSCSRAYG